MKPIVIPKNTTLLRVVINNPSKFYKQDWYFNHEFANISVEGTWYIDIDGLFPAGVWAYLHSKNYFTGPLSSQYLWTFDVDDNGDQVYVGYSGRGGFQIHRHLTIKDEMFLNKREG